MKSTNLFQWTLLCLAFISLPLAAQEKKDVVVKTQASEVTVFINGAQVTRFATVSLPAGKSLVRFTNLSPYIDEKSVQIKADGNVMILSVNSQLNYNDTVKLNNELKEYLIQIEAITDKITLERTNLSIVQEKLSFLQTNKNIGGTAGVNTANLQSTANYYGTQIGELKLKELSTQKAINKLSEEKTSLEKKASTVGSVKPEPTGEVLLSIETKTAVQLPVKLSYYVRNVSWFPTYDVRAKSISDPIEISYKANIMQSSKEDWKNIKLRVSSINPNLSSVAPKLQTYFLNYYTTPPRYNLTGQSGQIQGRVTDTTGETLIGASIALTGSTVGTITDINGNFSLAKPANGGSLTVSYIGYKSKTIPINSDYLSIVLEEEQMLLEEVVVVGYGTNNLQSALSGRVAGVAVSNVSADKSKKASAPPVIAVENTTSVEFEVEIPYTLPSSNKSTTVEVSRYEIPATYEYFCIPKIDKDAFLLASITQWEQYNLLEGEANIFFENTFVGKTILDTRNVSDTLNLSLGRDKSISVNRQKVYDYNAKKLLGSKTETTRTWEITIKNNKSLPVSMVLFDQVPVSTTQEIEVIPEKLSNGELNKENGEVKWKFMLPSRENMKIEFQYKVKHPKDRTLHIE